MSALAFAATLGILAFAVACLSQWLLTELDPYSKPHPNKSKRFALRAPALARRPVNRSLSRAPVRAKRHDVEIRELPFYC